MKIRNGFVSNSSSSSFIVIWDKKPESIKEIQKILFNDQKFIQHYSNEHSTALLSNRILNDTYGASEEDILDFIDGLFDFSYFNEFKWYNTGYKPDQLLLDQFEKEYSVAKKLLKDSWNILEKYSDKDRIRIYRILKLKTILDEKISDYDKEYITAEKNIDYCNSILYGKEKKLTLDSYQKFMTDFKDKFISIYEFNNHTPLDSCLENYGVFDNLTHFTINKH
jgi:hypothetical protein